VKGEEARIFFISCVAFLFLCTCSYASTPKKVLIVVARKDFRDEEYKIPRDVLEKKGALVKVASDEKGEARGMRGLVVQVELPLSEVKTEEYDAVIFVGGSGASALFNNGQAHRVAQETVARGRLLGAICLAPSILAHAGVLRDKKATVFSSERGTLKKYGARYTGAQVERDGLIITADGPLEAKKFADLIIQALYK
jgi:protease I